MPSNPKGAPDRAEIERLLTQLQRLERRSGRRAASITVSVPSAVDPEQVAKALRAHIDAEVVAHNVVGASVCSVTTVEFELADEVLRHASGQWFVP